MSLSRRGFLAGVGVTALAGVAAACSSSKPTASSASPSFTYTDGRGKQIDLAARPSRVVAQSSAAAALWDAGYHVSGVYGELQPVNGKLDYQAGDIDLSKMTVIGRTYGQFNIEQYAALRPQLLVDFTFDDKTLWYVSSDVESKISSIAPTLGIAMPNHTLPQVIDMFVGLAGQLGADTKAAVLDQAKAEFDSACTAVRTAAAAHPLRVLGVSWEADKFYFADPHQHPDLAHLGSLGVRFVGPKAATGTYFVETSFEQAGRYPADLIVYDARAGSIDALKKIPTWNALPAVRAGQVRAWYPAAPYSWASYTPLYREFASSLGAAKAVVS